MASWNMASPSWPGPGCVPRSSAGTWGPAPHLMGWLTISVELVGGMAVLLGALVPLASIPMAAVLLVAMITVHLPYGFSSIKLQAVTVAGAVRAAKLWGRQVMNESGFSSEAADV